jgi:hypothetical protein
MRLRSISVVAAIIAIAVAPATQAASTAKLRLVSKQPLVVRGEAFRPGERVVVTAVTLTGPKRVVVRATAGGRLAATFRLANQPCGDAVAVRAVGGRGSRAMVEVPARPCVPPPID